MKALSVVSLLALVSQGFAQFVTPPEDLLEAEGFAGVPVRYKQVPTGICEQDPNVKSYSGYLDVADNEHLFFWFFEAREVDPSTAPLTVWINGGPGSSSMIGLFQELGPCRINRYGKPFNNPHSWTNVSNVIFIDQPVTVGLSYSIPVPAYQDLSTATGDITQLPDNTCPDFPDIKACGTFSTPNQTLTANSTQNAAPNMWRALQGFMGVFPQYSRNEFHFTTESYGGHYGPVFNEYFVQQNALNLPNTTQINLKTVAIGNGWYNPLVQYGAYYNFTVFPGNTYDYFPFDAKLEDQMYNAMYGPGNCYDRVKYCHESRRDDVCSTADTFCADQVELVLDNHADREENDIRYLDPYPFPPSYFIDYLNTDVVRAAIGAYQNYSEYSYVVGNSFANTGDDSRESMTVQDLQKLLNQGITVMMYTGDADYNCNWLGGQVIAHRVDAPGFRDRAGFTDIETSDGVVHGQVKQAGKFSFVRIYESGHEVPFYQPLAALAIFDRAINSLDIATGTLTVLNETYVSFGSKTSDYREGNATVQFKVTPPTDVYNTTTGAPSPPPPRLQHPPVHALRKRIETAGKSMRTALKRKIRWAKAQAHEDLLAQAAK